jgi:hypothetical protein
VVLVGPDEDHPPLLGARCAATRARSSSEGMVVRLIFSPTSLMAYWALIPRPDRGRQTLNGWWAPVALRYIKGVGAGGSMYEVHHSHHFHLQTLFRSERVRSQRREAPPVFTAATATALHHRTQLRHLLFPNRRCPCADPHHRTSDGRILLQPLGWSMTHPLISLYLSSPSSSTSRMQVHHPARSSLVDPTFLTMVSVEPT